MIPVFGKRQTRAPGRPATRGFDLARFLPLTCIVCRRAGPTTHNLCEACSRELPWIETACDLCGLPALAQPLQRGRCGACVLSPPPFRFCKGLFHYRTPVAELLSGFKFNAHFANGRALSSLLAETMQSYYAGATPPDLLLPVPLHYRRLQARGYNQAGVLARAVGRRCGIPVSHALVARKNNTQPQTAMQDAKARRRNMRNAFALASDKDMQGVKSITIIDDVVTTMATVVALAELLTAAGVEDVTVWCVARASRDSR